MIKKTKYTRKVVVMDCDGVVADFGFSLTQVTKKLFGKPEYPIGTFQAQGWGVEWLGLTKKDEDQFWDYIRESETDQFWVNEREMIPGIVRDIYQVAKRGDFVWYFCTTRDDCNLGSAHEQTHEFLSDHGFFRPQVVVSDKKGDFCVSVNADYFIDDKFSNCKEVMIKSPNTAVFFLMLPSQAEYKEQAEALGMTIITSVTDFLEALKPVYYVAEFKQFNGNDGKGNE